MPTNTRPRIRCTAVVIAALAAVALLAAGCSTSSSSSARQATVAEDVNLCIKNETGTALDVEFKWIDIGAGTFGKRTASIGPGTSDCQVDPSYVMYSFNLGGVPVGGRALHDSVETKLSVGVDGDLQQVSAPDLTPGGNYFRTDVGPFAIWYGLGADTTDMKNFFVTVTSPS